MLGTYRGKRSEAHPRNGNELKIKKNNSGQSEDNSSNGRICLIIGYKKQSGKIAMSDSGSALSRNSIKASQTQTASTDHDSMHIIEGFVSTLRDFNRRLLRTLGYAPD